MHTLNYKQIQKIEISATEKLFNYISRVVEYEDPLENIEFFYPDFDDNKNKIAFNIWLSMDFITRNGKNFIDNFLDENPIELTNEEKSILIEKSKSNVSLFEIIDIKDSFIEVIDLVKNTCLNLWDPELSEILSIGDIIFARIGNLLGNLTFIGDLNYLPPSTKFIFLKQVFFDFNKTRLKSPMLTIEEYLKKYSLNLYGIYTNCMFEAMEMEEDEDITSNLYDQLDEFEAYLQLKTPSPSIRKHMTNLMDFFEYYLEDHDLTLYDIDELDFNIFFKEAIKDGFISSHEDLYSYISTFKKYLKFLSNIHPSYKDTYKYILNVSQNRFAFIKYFESAKSPFKIDRNLVSLVSGLLNEEAISLLMDLDKFIIYILDQPLNLTTKQKRIKRKDLFEIISILETDQYPRKKAPNQEDFPIIHLFFNLAISLKMISIEDNILSVTKKGSNYLRLRDEEKYILFFQYIWSKEFISEITNIKNQTKIQEFKKGLIATLDSFVENTSYDISTIFSAFFGELESLFEYYFYLQYLGILKCNLYPNYEIKLTTLGKNIIDFLGSQENKTYECSIISLDSFKNSK